MPARVAPIGHVGEVVLIRDGGRLRAELPRSDPGGFSSYVRGRLAEDLPMYAGRIDGGSGVAHHLAAALALDSCYGVTPSEKANALRMGLSAAGIYHRHLSRLIFSREGGGSGLSSVIVTGGVIGVKEAFVALRLAGEAISILGGRGLNPERGIPGGMTSGPSGEELARVREIAESLLRHAVEIEEGFRQTAVEWVMREGLSLPLPSLAIVDEDGKSSLFTGELRLVDPEGSVIAAGEEVLNLIDKVPPSPAGPYRVGVLARLNVAGGIPTPKGEEALERLWDRLGEPPIHRISAGYWGTLVELIAAAETLRDSIERVTPGDDDLRLPLAEPGEGIGAVESPDGTLIHRYTLDREGIVQRAKTVLPSDRRRAEIEAALAIALDDAADADERLIERIESVVRAFQPALVPDAPFPLRITLRDENGDVIEEWR